MLNQPNENCMWINKIKEILLSVGRPDLWENQFVIKQLNLPKYIPRYIKNILIDQQWHDHLQQSNKGII